MECPSGCGCKLTFTERFHLYCGRQVMCSRCGETIFASSLIHGIAGLVYPTMGSVVVLGFFIFGLWNVLIYSVLFSFAFEILSFATMKPMLLKDKNLK